LVATDIAARGIDVTALSHVVNFDVPDVPESYIHRVGRTARAEMTGDALTFVAAEEEATFRTIERSLATSIPRVQLDGFDYMADSIRRMKPVTQRSVPSNRGGSRRTTGRSFGGKRRLQAGRSQNKEATVRSQRKQEVEAPTERDTSRRPRGRNSRRSHGRTRSV
ncbi:MAG: ATP-dependent helicase, partial [candidate division Zixibacteria bacterium]|nr:ATP-dependent helicase [candidate division Zixibacteria bacterium]